MISAIAADLASPDNAPDIASPPKSVAVIPRQYYTDPLLSTLADPETIPGVSIQSRIGIIVERIAIGLRNKRSYHIDQCYVAAAPAYIDGQEPLVVQVIPGTTNNEGEGDGEQTGGGGLVVRLGVSLTVWYRSKMDMHSQSQQALIEASTGLTDEMELIRQALALTVLGSMTLRDNLNVLATDGVDPVLNADMLKYVGESGTSWFDMDKGVLRRDMMLTCAFGVRLPTSLTMTNADFEE